MASDKSESCPFCSSSTPSLRRAVKRKLETTDADRFAALCPPPPTTSSSSSEYLLLARVETDNECRALRETLATQNLTIHGLQVELDEERSASSSAASEAMSMIIRLQREKSEIAMEARQFKRYAEEKMSHDQQVIGVLEDGIYKREHEIRILWHELQDYKERLLTSGVALDFDLDFDLDELGFDDNNHDYPQINCQCGRRKLPLGLKEEAVEDEEEEQDKEDDCFQKDEVLEKGVVTNATTENSPPPGNINHHQNKKRQPEEEQEEEDVFPVSVPIANASKDDESCDRVYTIDAIHDVTVQEESVVDAGIEEADIKKLYVRLSALEADRESLKQELVSIQNNSSQDVQLKELCMEIVQNLSKSVIVQPPRLPDEEVNDGGVGSSDGDCKSWWFGFAKLPLTIRLGVPFVLKALLLLVYRKQIFGFLCSKNLRT